ncbi:MAG: DUF2917 domain-containing protein [Burkholderiales bacterium]
MYRTHHSLGFMPSTSPSVSTERSAAQHEKRRQIPSRIATPADVAHLAAEEMSVIRTKRRVTITCNEGALWITEDWHPADVALRPGESFKSTNAGRIIVQAFEPSSYRMTVDRTSRSAFYWQFIAKQISLAIRVLRARVQASQADRLEIVRRAPLPYC